MSILENMSDSMVSFEKIVFFTGHDEEGEALGELLHSHDDDKLTALFGFDTAGMDDDELVSSLEEAGYAGYFFANAQTPVRMYHSKDSSGYGFSWGHTRYALVCAKTFEDLVDKAVAWAKKEQEGMKNEA